MDLPTRIIAEKYEVLGVLGEGGTGIVYDAIRKEDERPVALKVMHPSLAGDRQIRGRFQREAAILRRLEGDHICPILDFGEVPGEEPGTSLLYIALPKIQGDSLAALLAKGPLDVDRALDIMLEVLAALKSAHEQGVIHRDLKPANVLLQDGKKVVVVDFGMSKIITGAGIGTTNLTTHNMVFGTPEYMSPEQARGDDLDARCDLYAAGVMLYEILTGAPPFIGPTPLSILTAHLTSDLEAPSKRASAAGRITPALESVIINALARDRDQRYSSADALAAAIVHARAAPNDVSALAPAAFAKLGFGANAPHRASGLARLGSSSSQGTDAFATTLPAAIAGQSSVDATAPTLLGSDRRPLVSSGAAPRPSSEPLPSSTPSSAGSETKRMTRTWVAVWVLVGVGSIAVGVYLALRP